MQHSKPIVRGTLYKSQYNSVGPQETTPYLANQNVSFDSIPTGKEVELSRTDLTSYMQYGTLSKSFIKKNNSELQNFIKTKKRDFPKQNQFFKTENEL